MQWQFEIDVTTQDCVCYPIYLQVTCAKKKKKLNKPAQTKVP